MATIPEDWLAISSLGLLILCIYYVLLIQAILEMLRQEVPGVVRGFSFLALIPFPPLIILGIFMLIIWKIHKKTLGVQDPND